MTITNRNPAIPTAPQSSPSDAGLPQLQLGSLRTFYPPIEPYSTQMLAVGDSQQLYVEQCGNPDGIPVVFLHGGPGGGCDADHRRVFDPQRYRIILFDQRGCGRSLPPAWLPEADLSTNTTWHLVEDMERIRTHLNLERWLIFGGSWGSTLALAYAQTHPQHCLGLVLRGIFTLRQRELDWYYEAGGADMVWPDEWEKFVSGAPGTQPGNFIARYHRLLLDPNPQVHLKAALAWTTWEAATSTLLRAQAHIDEVQEPKHALTFARIENHFFYHHGWLEANQLIDNAKILVQHKIPGVIVQGRYDMCCPIGTAWALHRAWPQAQLHISSAAGHSFAEPQTLSALITATDKFADSLS